MGYLAKVTMAPVFEKTIHQWIEDPGGRRMRLVQFSAIAAALLYLYAPILFDLVADWWNDPDYSHGFLIPLISAYFIWERRERLTSMNSHPNRWGLAVLLAGLSLLFLGQLGAELFVTRFSLVVVISGLVLYVLGGGYLNVLSFPIALLIFMIPLPTILLTAITFPLQLLAAQLSTVCLQIIEVPVFREGNLIFLPQTTLEVAEACSGIRSLVSLTALAVVFAYLTQRTIWKQSVLVVSAIPIAIIANAFRIWGTGALAHWYGAEIAESFYHSFAGWLIFVVAFGLLLVEGIVLSKLRLRWSNGEGR